MARGVRALALLALGVALGCARAGAPRPGGENESGGAGGPLTAIVGATAIHPERDGADAVTPDTTVLIAGARITAVGPAREIGIPPGARVIDAHGKWLIPGLIDGHVHFFQSGNLYTRPDVVDFNALVPYAKEDARNRARLPATFAAWLASGVTSVVDVGGPMWNFAVRDAARAAQVAPRVLVAGPLVSMIDRAALDLGDPPIIRAGSIADAERLVARELAHQPDYVKVWFIHQPGDDLAAQEAIVKSVGDAAHAAGVPLAVHATELETAKSALRAGADYLVHSVEDAPVDGEFLELAKHNHALYCPTLFVGEGYALALSNRWQPTESEARLADPAVLGAMRDLDRLTSEQLPARIAKYIARAEPIEVPKVMLDNLRAVWDAGIPVVMGTDAGNIGTLHGPSVFREMALMKEAGLTRLEVLRAATTNGARALRMEGRLGAIVEGQLADLVVLDGDPLADLANLSRAAWIIHNGRAARPEALLAPWR